MAEANWEDVLRNLLGQENADQMMAAMRQAGLDPAQMGAALGGFNEVQLRAMMEQTKRLLAQPAGINWELARDTARHVVHQGGDPAVMAAQDAHFRQAMQVADLWLDVVTDLAPAGMERKVWARAQWVESTIAVWREVMEPVALSAVDALAQALAEQASAQGVDLSGADAGLEGLAGFNGFDGLDALMAQMDPTGAATGPTSGPGLGTMLHRMAGLVFATQMGQAVGRLAQEVLGAGDSGLPLTVGTAALVPTNVSAFMDSLEVPADEVLAFLATREAATARLYAGVPWLKGHVLSLLGQYAREIRLDTEAIEEALRGVDVSDQAALQQALTGGMFSPRQSAAQERALEELQTLLAVIEGWVEEVTASAVAPHLPHAVALRESMRRRRAVGGPAEHLFASLVGLQLRPRRARDAAELWANVARERGVAERDALWGHPDLVPSGADLDSPSTFVQLREMEAQESAAMDDELARLLDGSLPQDDAARDADA
ncbi:zinc-dependent metalloprotease [Buchananella felis]|uniref:zinc-dependent metalloprotease n=1 Tax=Buchananella felis TaxID=3231492 RepID=UPI00352710FE